MNNTINPLRITAFITMIKHTASKVIYKKEKENGNWHFKHGNLMEYKEDTIHTLPLKPCLTQKLFKLISACIINGSLMPTRLDCSFFVHLSLVISCNVFFRVAFDQV